MTACLGGITARLLFVQGIDSARYQEAARSEYVQEFSYLGERGAILDRNGDELAMSVPLTTVIADPYQVDNPRAEATALAGPLGLPEPQLQAELSEQSGFVYLAHTVPDATAAKVEKLIAGNVVPGVQTIQEPKRFYPAGQLAAPLLGMVGTDGTGLGGLEYKYNSLLEGKPGQLIEDVDPSGDQIPGGLQEYQAPVRGDDLVLAIDEPLQFDTEEALARAIVAAQAESGMALIEDRRTGQLLAVAELTMPTATEPATLHEPPALPEWFVPPSDGSSAAPADLAADLAADQPVEAPSASAFTTVYEPGSVEKLVTISAALASGAITPTQDFEVPGVYDVAGSSFYDAWYHPTLDWTASDILAHSSDIGTIEIAQHMGLSTLLPYIYGFGMGKLSNVGFPGESAGIVPGPSQTSGTTLATIAYGQGIDVTAIQMLSAYNTIANGGVYVAPRLADGYIDAQGNEHLFPSPKPRRVVSPLVAAEMTSMLEGVVRVGTGTDASLTPYTVAGKTGTALVPSAGGYIQNFFVSSFAGFVPAEDPAITAMVVVVGTHQYGAEASAPVFAMIARDALQTLGVPPHKPEPPMPGVPLATPYGGEGEAAGGPLPGLTGTPDVVTPGRASTTSTTLAPGAAATTTTSPATAGGATSVPQSSGPSTASAATTTEVPPTTVPASTTVPAATTTAAGLTTTTASPAGVTTTAPPPAATTTAATTAPTVPAATTTNATTPAATTTTAPTTPATTPAAATTTAPTTATTAPAATTTVPEVETTVPEVETTVPEVETTVPEVETTVPEVETTLPAGTGSPASLLPGR
jgi:cell division protein FtsI (penicillin-binding protein 3)